MGVPLAHSPKEGVPAQSYREHIDAVVDGATRNAENAARFFSGDQERFIEEVRAAALFHDLGKLDDANQDVLRVKSRRPLPIRHEDAGIAALARMHRLESVVLVQAHHQGLFGNHCERAKQSRAFRFPEVAERVDADLNEYLVQHSQAGCGDLPEGVPAQLQTVGLSRRIALSCLVDADHSNTARNYGHEVPTPQIPPKWSERAAALDQYVGNLPQLSPARDGLRRQVYEACRDASPDYAMRSCDAAVGSGKTTAVMAHLLRVACVKNLRHIFVVLPYINIIKQSVDVYRSALVLPGERAEDVVAEHHHQADFASLDLRQLATLWRAPVIVTTAVQFFETLGSHHPAGLRKFHELPGSAAFIDETHAAISAHLWPQVWKWLDVWCHTWGGHVVFASGSLPRFWQLADFVDPPLPPEAIPDLLPTELRAQLEAAESRRIQAKRIDNALMADELLGKLTAADGPRLLIVNTVQSAAVLAERMRSAGHDVLHLSTALAPAHRDGVVARVKARLKYGVENWTLVATSCVEAGVDFSFRTGFRESASTASLIQVGGRVNRGTESEEGTVWDFRLLHDDLLTDNPSLAVPQRVLEQLFTTGELATATPGALALEAMRLEVTEGGRQRAEDVLNAESGMEYPEVARLLRVIEAQTTLVVVDRSLAQRLRERKAVDPQELVRLSVRILTSKIERKRLPVQLLLGDEEDPHAVYFWDDQYDPDFLGYMAGVLPLLRSLGNGVFLA